jgi:hypothetical protein
MNIETTVLAFPEFLLYLEVRKICWLSSLSKRLSVFILQHCDQSIWRILCKRDFDFTDSQQSPSFFRKKWIGLHKWMKLSTKRTWKESFHQHTPNENQTISLLNQFGTGILLHGRPIYMYPYRWDGSLIRCFDFQSHDTFSDSIRAITNILNEGHLDKLQSLTVILFRSFFHHF